jgi:predicted CXXCH cytochrome family protein
VRHHRSRCAGTLLLAALCLDCSATTRNKVLTMFFDGVPPLPAGGAQQAQPGAAPTAMPGTPITIHEHGPYAARLCGACHEAAATNALVAPRDRLCFQCHTLQIDKKYVHGPVASGGCLVCHDPHRSPNAYLLVSASDSFCFHCHSERSVQAIEGHEGVEGGCTECHDAHASDQQYLLK